MNSSKRSLNRKQIETQFDRAAPTYDSVAELQRRMGQGLVKYICDADVAKQDSLLDLGCGTGELLKQLSQEGFKNLAGLDLSSRMLAVAKKKVPTAAMLHADIEHVPCEEGAYRTVVSNAALQWCNIEDAFQEANRVLASNGRMFLTMFVQGTLVQWEQAFKAIGIASRVHKLPDVQSIESSIEAAGFTISDSVTRIESTAFDSVESMFNSIRKLGATNATNSRNDPLDRKSYLALKKRFLDLLDQGKLELDFSWVEVSAKK